MSFEREAISEGGGTAIPAQSLPPIMREERVYSPYGQVPKVPTPPTGIPPVVGQTDTSKAPEDAGTPPEDTVRLSPAAAAIARREQQFRLKQQQFDKEKASLAAEKEELAQLRAMKEKLAAKDYSGLEGLVDYNEYSQYQVNKINGSDPVQDEIKKLNGKITEIEKSAKDNVSKQFEAAVNERRLATTELVDKTDQFPRIKKAKAHETVVQHILDTWEHDSKELSVEQAAKEVEEILLEKARQWSALLEEKKEEPIEPDKKVLPPLKGSLKTLTNQVTAGDVQRIQRPLHLMSDAERYAEARRRAEEKLQKQGR